mmetsp:Transcript_32112/g.54160  ORF Transcript_32112/g.54160 Transcript_32112/m.54160 type:complete len:250 (-) Transcript_32112:67-816(-)
MGGNDAQTTLTILLGYAIFCGFVDGFASFVVRQGGFLSSLTPQDKRSFCNRTVSTLHATIMFGQAVYYWIYLNPAVEIVSDAIGYESRSVLIMCGYLIYDTIFEFLHGGQALTLAHHILGGASHASSLYSANSAALFYCMIIFVAEGSTPLLNISWLLQKLGLSNTALFIGCAAALILTFFVVRVVLSAYMVIHMILYQRDWGPDTDLLFWFNFVIVFIFGLLNYFWFYKLLKLAFGGKKEKRKTTKDN